MKLGDEIRSIESSKQFKKTILDFIRSKENSIYAIHNILGLKLLTRLRLNFSHLSEHKLRYNFIDTINPMCSCGFEPETTDHYILCCSNLYTHLRLYLLNDIYIYYKPILKIFFCRSTSKCHVIWFWKFYLKYKCKYSKMYHWILSCFFFIFLLKLAICTELNASVTCLDQVICPV